MDLTRLRNPRLREDLEFLFGSSWTYTELTDTVDIVATTVAITGNLTVSGSITYGATEVPHAYTYLGVLTVGLNDIGFDVKFYGATTGKYWMWDESGDEVIQVGNLTITGALALTGASALTGAVTIVGAVGITGATTLIGALTIGVDATGHDVIFYAETTGYKFFWDQNQDTNGGLTIIGTVIIGADDEGHDVKFYGATAGSYWLWDESENGVVLVGTLTMTGAASITGNVGLVGTLTVGVDDTGHDVKFYGAGTGRYWLWDENADTHGGVVIVGTWKITGASTFIGAVTVGVNDTGHDVKLYGATDGSYLLWDEDENRLELDGADLNLQDGDFLQFGDGQDIFINFDGTNLEIEGAAAATTVLIGADSKLLNVTLKGTLTIGKDDTGHDVKLFGATASSYLLWDEGDDQLELENASLTITETALAVDGRVMKLSFTSATPAMSDGCGAVEIDATISGTATGWFSPLSSWVNITGSGVAGAGGFICAQTNGVFADAGANTGSTIIFGLRASAMLTDAPTKLCPFSLNTDNRAITALFDIASAPAIGAVNSSPSSSASGTVPLFVDAGGQVRYIHIYNDAN